MTDEQEIIRCAQDGDEKAFEQLVFSYEKKIYNLAYRTCQNSQDAMDVTQEVFLRVFRAIKGFKGESSFSVWIYRIASNICIDYVRRVAKNKTVSLTIVDESGEMIDMDIAEETNTPELHYERVELRREIKKGLEALSVEHRHIIVLRDINGLSYTEIAEILTLEEGTVKSRLSRARAKLAEIMMEGNYLKKQQSNVHEGRRG